MQQLWNLAAYALIIILLILDYAAEKIKFTVYNGLAIGVAVAALGFSLYKYNQEK